MLDASIVSDPIHRPQGRVFDRIATHGGAAVCVSIITAAKLRHGCIGKGSARLAAHVDAVLASIDVLPFEGSRHDGEPCVR